MKTTFSVEFTDNWQLGPMNRIALTIGDKRITVEDIVNAMKHERAQLEIIRLLVDAIDSGIESPAFNKAHRLAKAFLVKMDAQFTKAAAK